MPRTRPTTAERARYDFLHRIGICAATGKEGDIQVAHIRYSDAFFGKVNPGMARKPHWVWTLPLSAEAHRTQHDEGEHIFWTTRYHTPSDALRSPLTAALVLEGFRALDDADAAREWLRKWAGR